MDWPERAKHGLNGPSQDFFCMLKVRFDKAPECLASVVIPAFVCLAERVHTHRSHRIRPKRASHRIRPKRASHRIRPVTFWAGLVSSALRVWGEAWIGQRERSMDWPERVVYSQSFGDYGIVWRPVFVQCLVLLLLSAIIILSYYHNIAQWPKHTHIHTDSQITQNSPWARQ